MKKYIVILFCSMLVSSASAQEKKLVLATASIFADMAENIAGDHLEIKTIVPIGGDPHIYEPTPADAQLISKADIILRNALTFEGWLDDLIEWPRTVRWLERLLVTTSAHHARTVCVPEDGKMKCPSCVLKRSCPHPKKTTARKTKK